jgi:phage shock protein C
MKRLFRIPTEGRIAGVCAGIANYLDADVTLIRAAWVILSIFPGAVIGGLLAYIAAWILMPPVLAPAATTFTGSRLTRSTTDRKIGGVCGGLAEYFGLDSTVVRVAVVILSIYPGAVICGIIAYAIAWFIIPEPPPLHPAVSPA